MSVIPLLPVPSGAKAPHILIIVMLLIRMQSGRTLGNHPRTKTNRRLNKELFRTPITQVQQDHPHSLLQVWTILLEDFLFQVFGAKINGLWLNGIWSWEHHLLCQELQSQAMDPKVLRLLLQFIDPQMSAMCNLLFLVMLECSQQSLVRFRQHKLHPEVALVLDLFKLTTLRFVPVY